MKKIIKYFLTFILIMSTIFLFSGCGSFVDEESGKIISSIERIYEDGEAKIVIRYENEDMLPDKFVLPKGAEGTGIKAVITTEKEDKSGKILKIFFTDESVEPISFELSNGRSISGVESEQNEEDGQLYMWVKYDDGTTTDKFMIPKGEDGKDGVGFIGYDYEEHEDGSQTYYFHFSQDEPDVVVEIPAPIEGNGIKSIISSEDETNYILTINYTNDSSDEVKFNKPKSPSKWIQGTSIPNSSEGEDGDYFFDVMHKVIYVKQYNTWLEVVNFNNFQEYFVISFNLNDNDGDIQAMMPSGSSFSYFVRANSYFEQNGFSIPIPTRYGYKFLGWFKAAQVSPINGAFTDLTPILSDLTLYACWEKID